MKRIPVRKSGLLFVGIILFQSCTLYYNTSEIDQSLKSGLEGIKTNCNAIKEDLSRIKSKYEEMGCPAEMEPFITAEKRFSELQSNINLMMDVEKELNLEYVKFLNYSKGKEKISSKSEEWEKLKTTKSKFKEGIKQVKSMGEKLAQQGDEFNTFSREMLTPAVSCCFVSEFVLNGRKGVDQLIQSKEQLVTHINEQAKQGKPLISKFSETHPDQIQEIKNEFVQIRKEIDAIDQYRIELNDIILGFEAQTKGKTKIYSCNPEWELVDKTENELAAVKNKLNATEKRIGAGIQSIQRIINELIESSKQ